MARKLARCFGFLNLMLQQHGRDDTDSGTSSGTIRLQLTNPSGVKGLQARVIVLRAETGSCANNPPTTVRGRAHLVGNLFNDGSSTGPGDRTGDIYAGIQQILDTVLGRSSRRSSSGAATPRAARSPRWTPTRQRPS